MILRNDVNSVERFGITKERTFTIKASSKAFQILSSQLYSNKILAVIREAICNSLDSHKEAGKENIPIEIHLPTDSEPYFSVKDFGVGLSHKNAMILYTTYFDSSKDADNSKIGGLGLGSKSPLSYVDSYTVTSIYSGIRSMYAIFINEEGCPSISLMSKEETTEGNGVEVSAAIKYSDFQSFYSNTENFLKRVFPKPIIKGHQIVLSELEPIINEGANWILRKNASNIATAILGPVSYPLGISEDSLDTREQKALARLPIEINFAIGEIEIAPSREQLSFDKKTIQTIKARFDAIIQEIRDLVSKDFEDCKNLWQARCTFYEVMYGKYKHFRSIINSKIEWQNIALDLTPIEFSSLSLVEFAANAKGAIKKKYVNQIQPQNNVELYWSSSEIGFAGRARNRAKNTSQPVYVAVGKDISPFLKEIYREGDKLPDAMSLEKPVRGPGTITDKGRSQVLELNLKRCNNSVAAEAWELPDEDFDIEDGGIYVETARYNIYNSNPKDFNYYTLNPLNGIKLDYSNLEVYGFKHKLLPEVKANPKWISFRDYIKTEVQKLVEDPANIENLKIRAKFKKLQETEIYEKWEFIKPLNAEVSSPFSTLQQIIEEKIQEYNKINSFFYDRLVVLINDYGIKMPEAPDENTSEVISGLLDKYPMIRDFYKALKDTYDKGVMIKAMIPYFNQYIREEDSKRAAE